MCLSLSLYNHMYNLLWIHPGGACRAPSLTSVTQVASADGFDLVASPEGTRRKRTKHMFRGQSCHVSWVQDLDARWVLQVDGCADDPDDSCVQDECSTSPQCLHSCRWFPACVFFLVLRARVTHNRLRRLTPRFGFFWPAVCQLPV